MTIGWCTCAAKYFVFACSSTHTHRSRQPFLMSTTFSGVQCYLMPHQTEKTVLVVSLWSMSLLLTSNICLLLELLVAMYIIKTAPSSSHCQIISLAPRTYICKYIPLLSPWLLLVFSIYFIKDYYNMVVTLQYLLKAVKYQRNKLRGFPRTIEGICTV